MKREVVSLTFIKEKLKEQEGAASVMVVLMMIVLATLGAFAVISAQVNYKLSNRVLESNQVYYELDSRGEDFLAVVDSALALAESEVNKKGHNSNNVSDFVKDYIDIADIELNVFLGKAYKDDKDSEFTVFLEYDEPENVVCVNAIFDSPGEDDEDKSDERVSLFVKLKIESDFAFNGEEFKTNEGKTRYKIMDWHQEPFVQREVDDSLDLSDDPFIIK